MITYSDSIRSIGNYFIQNSFLIYNFEIHFLIVRRNIFNVNNVHNNETYFKCELNFATMSLVIHVIKEGLKDESEIDEKKRREIMLY